MRSRRFQRFVEGIPVVLVAHGEIQHRSLMRERMTFEELMGALRQHEVRIHRLRVVQCAVCGEVENRCLAGFAFDAILGGLRPDKYFAVFRPKQPSQCPDFVLGLGKRIESLAAAREAGDGGLRGAANTKEESTY